jgi:hypothetical protein
MFLRQRVGEGGVVQMVMGDQDMADPFAVERGV